MSRRPSSRVILRDALSYAGGWLLMFSQSGFPGWIEAPKDPNELAMVIAGLLIGVPGLAQLIALRWGGGSTGIDGSPSRPAPSPSPTQSVEPSGVE